MGRNPTDDNLKNTSDYLKWQKIFNSLAKMLQSQQSQLETLATERKLLEERIQFQHQRWLSDLKLNTDHISQLKNNVALANLEHMVDESKLNLMVGMKEAWHSLYKSISEKLGNDLEDMRQVVECLSSMLTVQKGIPDGMIGENGESVGGDSSVRMRGKEDKRTKTLQDEIKRLKQANEKLRSQRNSEVSALVAERNFVWNQFKKMESDDNRLLKSKNIEVERANENMVKLESLVKNLQSSTEDKENIIVKLKAEIFKLEGDIGAQNKELSTLNRELEMVRSLRKPLAQKMINSRLEPCNSNSQTSLDGGSRKRNPITKEPSKLSCPSKSPARSSSLRKRRNNAIFKSENPKLFSSHFKVPKMKSPSPGL